ncbi:endoplasmic reticulum aminopeptidase 1-like isoform X1 [Haliotis cracherodii]|uniref:endoplasmic reticulum aminopeptidase 1-like isoform X1 n=2 Tax=Haliotis cracherodii TaxID=6455 RepID=UPI0039E84031
MQSLKHRRKRGASSTIQMEERSLIDEGDTILNKKAVYEPSGSQRCRQLVCSRSWAVTILIVMGLFLILIAIIASFARPQTLPCTPLNTVTEAATTPAPKVQTYIATNGKDFPWKDIRLPKNLIPESYDILIHPNISQSYFKGRVIMKVRVISQTDFVVFHIKNLNVTHFDVKSLKDGEPIHTTEYLEYKEGQQFYIKLGRSLEVDEQVEVTVKFEALLVNKLVGFYKSSYKLSTGEERHIATTHFEPTDARGAFPCFDEPQLKANFTLNIVRDKQHISLFNMPLKKTEVYDNTGLLLDNYDTSVKMSTYLVAFVVCDFANISKTTSDGVKVSVYAPSELISQADFALDGAVSVLEYYNSFFGVKYPLPKQDLIAIPDFAAGAMENWGLITYRMTAILYDPKVSSLGNKQWVATVVAHELAHQWFGNLVTMEWWDDLWLNEGFASYVEYIGADQINPDFHMHDQFVTEDFLTSMYLDSMSNSHPVHVPVDNPDEINEIFDKISYSKGGSVLRMLRSILGQSKFKAGLTHYLTIHKYSNARTDDLWMALQDANPKLHVNIKAVMDTWTKQMGYPVVTVKQTGTLLSLTQDRFLLNAAHTNDVVPSSPFKYKWYIPLTLLTSADNETHQLTWMNMTSAETTVPPNIKWIKANSGMNGFYRVNYDTANWKHLIRQLMDNHKVFSAADRAGLIDDAFNLARAGLVSQKIALDLTLYLVKEVEYVPWKAALDNLAYIESRIIYKEVYTNFKAYMLKLIMNRLTALQWTDSGSHLEMFLRGHILMWAVKLGNQPSIEKGKQLFQQWVHDHASIDPNLKTVIYMTGVKYGTEEDWRECLKVYEETHVPSEKQKMLMSMSYSRDTRLLNQYLGFSLNTSKVRSQDTETVINSIAANPSGQLLAWRFVQQNWDTFSERYKGGSFGMSRLIKGVASHFSTQFDYDEVKAFFAKRDAGSGTRAVKQSLEKIQMNIDWLERNEAEVTDWLNKHSS